MQLLCSFHLEIFALSYSSYFQLKKDLVTTGIWLALLCRHPTSTPLNTLRTSENTGSVSLALSPNMPNHTTCGYSLSSQIPNLVQKPSQKRGQCYRSMLKPMVVFTFFWWCGTEHLVDREKRGWRFSFQANRVTIYNFRVQPPWDTQVNVYR